MAHSAVLSPVPDNDRTIILKSDKNVQSSEYTGYQSGCGWFLPAITL
jgi:hypothetical protein